MGILASAIATSEDVEAAHAFVESTCARLDLSPEEQFPAWASLYEEGDESALPEARKAAGLASEQLTFLEELEVVEMGGQRSADKLVRLVKAGDKESIETARTHIDTVATRYQAGYYGDLCQTGDDASLELAIEVAVEVKLYAQLAEYPRSYESTEEVLKGMAQYAAQNDKQEDALRLIEYLGPRPAAEVHVDLYKKGREESLEPVLQFVQTPAAEYYAPAVQRALAQSGYDPALRAVRERVEGAEPGDLGMYDVAEDLALLHELGDPHAADKLEQLLREDVAGDMYIHKLVGVGRKAAALDILKDKLEDATNPNHVKSLKCALAELDDSVESFKEQLSANLQPGNEDFGEAARWVKALAARTQ